MVSVVATYVFVWVARFCVIGREVGQTPGRQRRLKTSQKGSNHARQKNRRGAAPKHRGGKHHMGETAHRETPPANPPRVLYEKRAAVQDWQRWEKILGLPRETKGTPHCWLM